MTFFLSAELSLFLSVFSKKTEARFLRASHPEAVQLKYYTGLALMSQRGLNRFFLRC